jgi:starch synthase (maltosyl-transferring)
MKYYFRGNLWTNTPDILAGPLQWGPKSAFKMRITLAATLSSTYGMYNGYELLENEKNPKKEEYANSEKYEYKVRDWNKPGNIKPYIARLNHIRRTNPALQEYDNLKFIPVENENIIAYVKSTPDKSNYILTVVNLDPHNTHDSFIYVPIHEFGVGEHEEYDVQDLITGSIWRWKGSKNYVRLDPNFESAHVIKIR